MAPSSVTSVATAHEDPSHYLSSSISSLSSQRAQSSWLAKTYRQAAQLYLTRRLAEALDAIEPAVLPDSFFSGHPSKGSSDEDGSRAAAPVALSSRGTRVKIWSFYLTLLNAIIEIGPEDGKATFGAARYKSIVSKAKTGSIWEDVIRYGYGGSEGQVDGEVVANLATLLLTHMQDQRLNQQRLETYLSACMYPAFDIAAHMEATQNGRPQPHRTDSAGTSTPRDLNTRLKLLELYTLHVLPRNEQWDYARDFITMSEVLDEERREAFLDALHTLREEKALDATREAERQKMDELRLAREEAAEAEAEAERRKREEAQKREAAVAVKPRKTPPPSEPSANGLHPIPNRGPPSSARPSTSAAATRPNRPVRKGPPSRPPPSGSGPPASFYQRASTALTALQSSFTNLMQHNPLAALRYFLFVFALVIALARRDIRQRLRRAFDDAMRRLLQTVGMGTKVSYI
ncbi:hypothetical protein ANO11243_008380 [Dothideomycetidae sp. 11243]|nr:hypothetical protein ANO11243_008380 [fungal sp. No.11243]